MISAWGYADGAYGRAPTLSLAVAAADGTGRGSALAATVSLYPASPGIFVRTPATPEPGEDWSLEPKGEADQDCAKVISHGRTIAFPDGPGRPSRLKFSSFLLSVATNGRIIGHHP